MKWLRTHRVLAGGLAAAVVGLSLLFAAAVTKPPVEFGWFAYAPLANSMLMPGPTAGQIFGMGLAAVGLIVVAGALGYLHGRRTQWTR